MAEPAGVLFAIHVPRYCKNRDSRARYASCDAVRPSVQREPDASKAGSRIPGWLTAAVAGAAFLLITAGERPQLKPRLARARNAQALPLAAVTSERAHTADRRHMAERPEASEGPGTSETMGETEKSGYSAARGFSTAISAGSREQNRVAQG